MRIQITWSPTPSDFKFNIIKPPSIMSSTTKRTKLRPIYYRYTAGHNVPPPRDDPESYEVTATITPSKACVQIRQVGAYSTFVKVNVREKHLKTSQPDCDRSYAKTSRQGSTGTVNHRLTTRDNHTSSDRVTRDCSLRVNFLRPKQNSRNHTVRINVSF